MTTYKVNRVRDALKNLTFENINPTNPVLDFAESIHRGLSTSPRTLPSKYLYDAKGSDLFEKICDLPEYYITRTEEQILHYYSNEIAAITGAVTLIELGAGTSRKTKILLDAYNSPKNYLDYIAVDVSKAALEMGQQHVSESCSNVEFHPLCTTWEQAFPLFSHFGRNMVVFLGSSIGNLDKTEFANFFNHAANNLKKGDFFLLGLDLHKDTGVLEAAYNDSAGVTAAFTQNLFVRMNTELDSELDIEQIKHNASYNQSKQQIEIHAEFLSNQELFISPLNKSHHIKEGQCIHTEISRKFEIPSISERLASSGFKRKKTFTDQEQLFALLLLERS